MSTTRQATTGFSTSVSDIEDDGTLAQTMETSETSVYLGSQNSASSSATTLAVAVDATAIGTDTLSAVEGEAVVSANQTNLTIQAYAIAESEDDLAFSTAVILVDFQTDADLYFSISQSSSSQTVTSDGSVSISEAWVKISALDFGDPGSGETPPASETIGENPAPGDSAAASLDTAEVAPCSCGDDGSEYQTDIDGNLAIFDITAIALGEDTTTSVSFDAFALEDQFSSVTGVMFIVVD
jgi:hypothetical protein